MSCESKAAARPRTCAEAQRYLKEKLVGGPKVAVVACEGACVKGEVARIAANVLAYRLERGRSLRICLGEAVTADSGFREAVAGAPRVIVVEGCGLRCGSEILKQRVPDVALTPITASTMYEYDRSQFEIADMPPEQLASHGRAVAERIQATCFDASARGC